MSETKQMALIGTFSDEEKKAIKKLTKKIWNTEKYVEITGGFKTALEIIPLIGMSVVVVTTSGLLKPPPIGPDDFPSFQKMRETKNCPIGVCLGSGEVPNKLFSPNNLPDFVINLLPDGGILRTL